MNHKRKKKPDAFCLESILAVVPHLWQFVKAIVRVINRCSGPSFPARGTSMDALSLLEVPSYPWSWQNSMFYCCLLLLNLGSD